MTTKVYSDLLASLLPPGPAWTTEPRSNLTKLLTGLSGELERVDDQSGGLVLEANPLTMSTMLDIRYTEAGLPDLCKGKPEEDSEQQYEVVGKWSARSGQSIGYFYEVAEKYGFDIDINEYEIFKIEHQGIETLGLDSEYAYSWEINYVDGQQLYFRAGENKANDRLEIAKGIGINCIFDKLKPAHTSIIYTAWDSAIDMRYRPLLNYNFQDMAEVLPTGITYSRTDTATRTDEFGVIVEVAENMPRFDYDPELLFCKGVLNESGSQNFCTYNRDLSQASWTKTACSTANTDANCPDGTISNAKIIENSANTAHTIDCCTAFAQVTNVFKTFSGYVKANGRTKFRALVVDSVTANYFYADFDLVALTATGAAAGTATFTDAKLKPFNNGWYRFEVTGIPASANSGTLAYCRVTLSNGSLSYLGDGASGINLWGAQFENKEGATSVIFTGATSVIRSSESYTFDTSTTWWANVAEGTFALTLFKHYLSTTNTSIVQVDFGINDLHWLKVLNDTITYEVQSGGVTTSALSETFTDGEAMRIGATFKKDDFGLSINGSTPVTDASGNIPVVSIAANFTLNAFNGHVTQFVFYGERIEDVYLQEISTIG